MNRSKGRCGRITLRQRSNFVAVVRREDSIKSSNFAWLSLSGHVGGNRFAICFAVLTIQAEGLKLAVQGGAFVVSDAEDRGNGRASRCPPRLISRIELSVELDSLASPTKLHLSDLVIVGLNLRVGSLVRELRPVARNFSHNFAILDDFKFGSSFLCSQLIITWHNLSTSDRRGFCWLP